jgi:DNA-binding CsgD family transcriptional regulator
MEDMRKRLCPSCLGVAPILALVPFLVRVNNPFLLFFSDTGFLELFKCSFGGSAFLTCVILYIASRKDYQLLGNRTLAAGASFVLALSLLSGTLLIDMNDGLSLAGLCVAIGVIMGTCLVITLGSWGHAFGLLEPQAILLHSALSFFVMALLWAIATSIQTSSSLCILLAIYVLLSCASYLFYRHHLISHRYDSAAQLENVSVSRGMPDTRREAVEFLWVSFFGIAFSFLAAGMTYEPSVAGLGTEVNHLSKPLSYGLLALGICVMFFVTRKHGKDVDLDLLYKTLLPIGAAILMVFPYIDANFPELVENIIGMLGYFGFALFNVLAWAAAAMVYRVCGASVDRAFLSMFALCSGIFLLSSEFVDYVGSAGQTFDLGVLVAYVAIMTISAIRTGRSQTILDTPPVDTIVLNCEQLAGVAGLSARESEVLHYVAKGRTTNRIAEELCISPNTVRTHIKRIYEKTGVHKREELIELISGD